MYSNSRWAVVSVRALQIVLGSYIARITADHRVFVWSALEIICCMRGKHLVWPIDFFQEMLQDDREMVMMALQWTPL